MKTIVSAAEFVGVWNESASAAKAAEALGVTTSYAICRAHALRKQGQHLRNFKQKVDRVCVVCGKVFKVARSVNRPCCSRECRAVHPRHSKHGESNTRLHNIWCGMKSRCKGTAGPLATEYYSDRGIEVCEQWHNDYLEFRSWALENGYEEHLELDRIDNAKGYSPDNCRWATRQQQMANTRKRRDGTTSRFKGVSWCENVGRWRAQGHDGGRPVHLGLFHGEVEAAMAYDRWATAKYGEFASINLTQGGVPS